MTDTTSADFQSVITPPPADSLVLEVTALRFGPRIQRMRGEAKVDGQLCADAELMSVCADRPRS